MRLRRTLPVATVVLLAAISGCGSEAAGPVAAGSSGGATTSSPASEGSAESPVDGLTAEQLKTALQAPLSETLRNAAGPTADRVATSGGQTAWRVRVPGQFNARGARVSISVGGELVGEAVLAPDLASIATVTTDAGPLRSGAAVSYQWEGSDPVPAGNLTVIR